MRTKPTVVWRTREEWRAVVSAAVASGSHAQMRNVMEMALQDIETLHDAM